MPRFADLTGQVFGRLTVECLSDLPVVKGNRHWICRCSCSAVVTVSGFHLKSGHTVSCGCLRLERTRAAKTRHGHARKRAQSLTYRSWANMIKRCTNPAAVNYDRYGGRGIRVCERWRDFALFLADMGERPSADHEIDRQDSDGHYEPGNCRWLPGVKQAANRRSARMLDTPRGRMSLTEAAQLAGIGTGPFSWRVANWPPDRWFEPPRRRAT